MITNEELQIANISTTHKDFYQIYNELLDAAKKISDRWDPTVTNESDPGIVLLKVLTGIADKLNYNVDKNILEAFMPSATQEESMRKLCEMVGYNMKYYQSAETDILIKWIGEITTDEKFVLDSDTSISELNIAKFSVIKDASEEIVYSTVQPVKLYTSSPFVTVHCIEGEVKLCQTNNANNAITAQNLDSNRYYLPELQIAENGIFIYNNTDGIDGEQWEKVDNLNTQPADKKCFKFGFSSQLGLPYVEFNEGSLSLFGDGLHVYYTRTKGVNGNIAARTLTTLSEIQFDNNTTISSENFALTNYNATTNGQNAETISQSYNSYKKIVGTFDTLVTCRDYINKVYSLLDEYNKPYVSNIIVSDIRDDLNRAVTVNSFDENGLTYNVHAVDNLIDHFDLVFYPFKTTLDASTKQGYEETFTYSTDALNYIKQELNDYKTISHNITAGRTDELACIKNKLKLSAKIATTYKVDSEEEKSILANINKALYLKFNARQLDFGEEIPYDEILACIEAADSRIKTVILDEPEVHTVYHKVNNAGTAIDVDEADADYNNWTRRLIARNVLAGKTSLYNYDTTFKPALNSSNISIYGTDGSINKIIPKYTPSIDAVNLPVKLGTNDIIQFRIPNFSTTLTYPAYVNYKLHLNNSHSATEATAAEATPLKTYLAGPSVTTVPFTNRTTWETITTAADLATKIDAYGVAWKTNDNGATYEKVTTAETLVSGYTYYAIPLIEANFIAWTNAISSWSIAPAAVGTNFYRALPASTEYKKGYLVDDGLTKYNAITTYQNFVDNFASYYVMTNLGEDAVTVSIPANIDYKLLADEYIIFNYTPSGDGSEQINEQTVYYGPGAIIRPSMKLTTDSSITKTLAAPISIVKKGGADVTGLGSSDIALSTLGPNEQIEIRQLVQVQLAQDEDASLPTKSVNISWYLNNSANEWPDGVSYTLQDGEYFFYTDASKLSLAYYGTGTEIVATGINLNSFTPKKPDLSTVFEQGIDAIDWQLVSVTTTTATSAKYITCTEYQYKTLTSGCTITSINGPTGNLSSTFVPVNSCEWMKPDGTTDSLSAPQTGQSWQVRSLLILNTGPSLSQTLAANEAIAWGNNNESVFNCSVKLNMLVQSSNPIIYSDDEALSIQSSTTKDVTVDSQKIEFDNYASNWTKVQIKAGGTLTLYPSLYYDNDDVTKTQSGMLMTYIPQGQFGVNLNNLDAKNLNADDATPSTLSGISCLKLTPSSATPSITFKNTDQSATLVLIFSDLDILDTTQEYNPALGLADSTEYSALITEIRELDTNNEFYYNAILDRSNIINLNTKAGETLKSSKSLFDYNNIANKFTISEIDTNYLKTGITLTKASKL